MDVRGLLRRTAMNCPAVLAVTVPGATALRLEAEAELRRRGWPLVAAPAAADLLLVCGVPDRTAAAWVDGIERSVPEPAVRIAVERGGQVAHALDVARRELTGRAVNARQAGAAHPPVHHREATDRPDAPRSGQAGHGSAQHPPTERPGKRQGHGAHGSGHGHHPHHDGSPPEESHGHAMGEVGGLPMAGRADDRDALKLDRLHVPFGPGLSDWPTGLILRLTLQGDVVQGVEVDHLPVPSGHGPPFWDEPWLRAAGGEHVTRGSAARRRCAAHLDSAGRLLAVTGWDDAAARCRLLRDGVLSGASREAMGGVLRGTVRRIGRSRTLRWSIAGLGRLPAGEARAAGVSGPALAADGDAHDRLLTWLRETERGLDALDDMRPLTSVDRTGPRGRLDGPKPPSQALLDVLPALLTGAEYACARIILASLDPDVDALAPAPVSGAVHG
ncbi:hypothetical protein ACFUJY_17755 [Streptomyces sp. NPDC057249]|uniref:hypothetical protein n=1 Tax=Streptomyces sp. NPDC057249 TaxID=3346067 RepID=UPI0036341012